MSLSDTMDGDFDPKAREGEILTPEEIWPVRRINIIGGTVAGSLFLFLGVWGYVAPLSSAVIAGGEVQAAQNRQVIQHLEGGTVREIRVENGATVRAGDPLILLDDLQQQSEAKAAREALFEADATLIRLDAEATRGELLFPKDILGRAAADPKSADVLENQRQLFEARRDTRQKVAVELQTRILGSARSADIARDQVLAKQRQMAVTDKQLSFKTGVFERGLTTQDSIYAINVQQLQTETEISALKGQVNQNVETGKQAMAERDRRNAEFLEAVRTEIRDTRARRRDTLIQLARLETQIDHAIIRAPATGTVSGLTVHTVGGVIGAGQPLGLVVPQQNALLVETAIRLSDVDQVHPGQTAFVRFSAFNQRTTPEIEGTVKTVSADRISNPDGSGSYLAEITLPHDAAIDSLPLMPGMPAEVFIRTGERSFWSYLLKPLSDNFHRALTEE